MSATSLRYLCVPCANERAHAEPKVGPRPEGLHAWCPCSRCNRDGYCVLVRANPDYERVR